MKEEEFLAAYESLSDALFRHSYFRLYERERAKDAVQDAFIKTWDYARKGGEIANIRAFLYRVLNNVIVDEIRRKKAISLEVLLEEGYQPLDNKSGRAVLENSLEIKNLLKLMYKLEEGKRDLLIMRYVDGFGPKEIAEVVGESENVISVRLSRAVKELKEIFENGK